MGSCSDGSCSVGSCDDKERLPPSMLQRYDLDQETGLGTLIWAENDGNMIDCSVLEMIGMIREDSDDRIFAMITGDVSIKPLYEMLFSYGVDTVYHIRNDDMIGFDADKYAQAFIDLADRIDPAAMVIAGTDRGRRLADAISKDRRKEILTYCTSIRMEKNTLAVTRNIPNRDFKETDIHLRFPILATYAPGTHSPPEKEDGRKGTAIGRPFRPSFHQ